MASNLKQLIFASGLIAAIGIVLIVISLILQLVLLIAPADISQYIDLANTVYAFILYPIMFSLYLWAGVRAVRKYNFDAIGAGLVAAFAYFVTGLAQLFLGIVLSIIVLSRFSGTGGFSTPESVLAGAIFEDVMGMRGVGLSAVCGIGILVFGTVINFVVGGFGGIFALSGTRSGEYG